MGSWGGYLAAVHLPLKWLMHGRTAPTLGSLVWCCPSHITKVAGLKSCTARPQPLQLLGEQADLAAQGTNRAGGGGARVAARSPSLPQPASEVYG